MAPLAPNRVEAYLSLESEKKIMGNVKTYESAMHGVANADKLQGLRHSRQRKAMALVSFSSSSLIYHSLFFFYMLHEILIAKRLMPLFSLSFPNILYCYLGRNFS